MLHLFVDECRQQHIVILIRIDAGHLISIAIVDHLATTACSSHQFADAVVDVAHRHRHEAAGELLDIILVLLRAVAYLHTLECGHLEQRAFIFTCLQCFLTGFPSVGITRLQVDIGFQVLHGLGLRNLLIGQVGHGRVLGEVNVIVVGIVVLQSTLHVLALLLAVALSTIHHPYARYLLNHLVHLRHLAEEIKRRRLRAEHIAQQIGCHLVLLVVVVELDAE